MWPIFAGLIVLGALSLFGIRWAYVGFVLLALLYFPARTGFHLDRQPCEIAMNVPLAILSLRNYAHIVLFAVFFIVTLPQFRGGRTSSLVWAVLATVLMGALVEVAEGATGRGHCRSRDLIPDFLGAILGMAVLMAIWRPAALLSLRRRKAKRP